MQSNANKIVEALIQYTGNMQPVPLEDLESVLCDYFEDYGGTNEYAVVHKNVIRFLEDKFDAPTFSKFINGSDNVTFTLSISVDPSIDLGFIYTKEGRLGLAYAYKYDENGDYDDVPLKKFEKLRKTLENMLQLREQLTAFDPFDL